MPGESHLSSHLHSLEQVQAQPKCWRGGYVSDCQVDLFNFLLIKIPICCFRWLIFERMCSAADNVLMAGYIVHATPTNEVYPQLSIILATCCLS